MSAEIDGRAALRRRGLAAIRAAAYLGAMVGVLLLAIRLSRRSSKLFIFQVMLLALPAVIAITALFAGLRPADRAAWRRLPTRAELRLLGQGAAAGGAAVGAMLTVKAALGWVRSTGWGWDGGRATPAEVLASAAVTAIGTLAVAYNEEQIFRGYGLDALCDAFGLGVALTISDALFTAYHRPNLPRAIEIAAAGLMLSLMRLRTGSLWFGFGYHVAWNVAQDTIFGWTSDAPSLRPLELVGPRFWVGQAAPPEGGWFAALVAILNATLTGLWAWRGRRGRG